MSDRHRGRLLLLAKHLRFLQWKHRFLALEELQASAENWNILQSEVEHSMLVLQQVAV